MMGPEQLELLLGQLLQPDTVRAAEATLSRAMKAPQFIIELAERLVDLLTPEDMRRVFFTSGGSDSVETALRLARQYWKVAGEPERLTTLRIPLARAVQRVGRHSRHEHGVRAAVGQVEPRAERPRHAVN